MKISITLKLAIQMFLKVAYESELYIYNVMMNIVCKITVKKIK